MKIIKGEKFSLTILNDTECIMAPTSKEISKFLVEKFGQEIPGITTPRIKKLGLDIGSPADAKQDPLIPSPDDFRYFPYRLISATIVGSGTWKATDFSDQKVLKASIPLLNNRPAYLNHIAQVGTEIGTIGMCEWTKEDGDMPSGIDGPYVLDSVLYPELCRKMLSPVSPIQSSSVTVIFDWVSSHEFENDWDFYQHVGETINGEEVRRIVTNIHQYIESSLVYQGADPFAKMKNKDGNGYLNIPLNRELISNSAFGDENPQVEFFKETKRIYAISNFSADNVAKLRKSVYLKESTSSEAKNEIDMSLQKALALKLNIPEAEITEEKIQSLSFLSTEEFAATNTAKEALTAAQAEVVNLKASVEAKDGEIVQLKTAADLAKPMVENGTRFIESLKAQALDSYRKEVSLKKGTEDPIIVKEIEDCFSIETLNSKIKLFNGKLLDNFAAHCTDCGSEKVSFRSSESDNESKKKEGSGTHLYYN